METPHQARVMRRSIFSRLVETLDGLSPYWEPQVVVALALALDLALPDKLTVGPTWLLPAVEGALLLVLAIASPHPAARHAPLRRYVAIGLIALVSAVNIFSLALLCHYLVVSGTSSGKGLILDGVVLWLTNVLLFGLWFYELDRGGPGARLRAEPRYPDFMFPNMAEGKAFTPAGWLPRMVDYLYLSFTNATAFSPTDTMPLTAQAKSLMTVQGLASLVTVGLVIARAVNILK